MPGDISDGPVDQQAKCRRVLSGDKPMVAVDQDGGVTALFPMRIVPRALWRSPLWRRCAVPDWACNVTDPGEQLLILALGFANQQQDTIDTLKDLSTDLREVRRQSKAGAPAADVTSRIDKIGIRILDLYRALDQ